MGGISPETGFDCSGFTQYVFKKAGVSIPRSSRAQAKAGEKINLADAQTGDLVFFSQNKERISHVGIVLSPKGAPLSMIHASSSKGPGSKSVFSHLPNPRCNLRSIGDKYQLISTRSTSP